MTTYNTNHPVLEFWGTESLDELKRQMTQVRQAQPCIETLRVGTRVTVMAHFGGGNGYERIGTCDAYDDDTAALYTLIAQADAFLNSVAA